MIICSFNNNFPHPLLTSDALPFFFPLFVLPVGTYRLCPTIQPDLQATPCVAAGAIKVAVTGGY